ncbi:MAG: DUF4065 domain-containing protein [Bacteroidaceae bacterium]|nr:DUF4065 domain-containing protein [Bacteroidaceae bacterium]
MKPNALSLANLLIKLAAESGLELRPLRLMKLVYFAHGFSIALFNRSLLDERFDVVEAWRYGPVIPSVYHTFKYLKNAPVTPEHYAVTIDASGQFHTPILQDEDAEKVARYVLDRYKGYTDSDLVTLTHQDGTPWSMVYEAGKNARIPDEYTKVYYAHVVKSVLDYVRQNQPHGA